MNETGEHRTVSYGLYTGLWEVTYVLFNLLSVLLVSLGGFSMSGNILDKSSIKSRPRSPMKNACAAFSIKHEIDILASNSS